VKVYAIRELRKTLEPSFRWDDVLSAIGLKIVIPAKAGIQCFSLNTLEKLLPVQLNKWIQKSR
jgi:hypothetical protein